MPWRYPGGPMEPEPGPWPAEASASTSLPLLLTAVRDLASGRDLDAVLHRVVQLACRASGARYGALGVIDPVDPTRLSRFITYGISDEERAQIGDLPAGLGLLGRLISDPRPLRLADLAQAKDSVGFPPGHPPMRSFLGVPVQVGDRVFGNLYLTEKRAGPTDQRPDSRPRAESHPEFTEPDEDVVSGLASIAGAVIDNVQQRAALQAQRSVVDGIWQIHHSLRSEFDPADVLPLITDRVLALTGARAVAVVRTASPDSDRASTGGGDSGPGIDHVTLASSGDAARALHILRNRVSTALARGAGPDADDGHGVSEMDAVVITDHESAGGRTRTSLVPVPGHGERATLLAVAHWRPGGGLSEDRVHELLDLFATQVALVLDQAERDDDRRMLALLEDRDRIARDLHDLVIQRLFAVGLQLQGASRLAGRPQVVDRLQSAVTELDATIRDIRASIFELHYRPGHTSLRTDLRDLVTSYATTLGFDPVTQVRGPVDSSVADELQIQVLAVLREALSNVARHARASACQVEVEVTDDTIEVRVADDGVGIADSIRESGVRNIRSRAEAAGGSLQLTRRDPQGTELIWRAPLDQPPT